MRSVYFPELNRRLNLRTKNAKPIFVAARVLNGNAYHRSRRSSCCHSYRPYGTAVCCCPDAYLIAYRDHVHHAPKHSKLEVCSTPTAFSTARDQRDVCHVQTHLGPHEPRGHPNHRRDILLESTFFLRWLGISTRDCVKHLNDNGVERRMEGPKASTRYNLQTHQRFNYWNAVLLGQLR